MPHFPTRHVAFVVWRFSAVACCWLPLQSLAAEPQDIVRSHETRHAIKYEFSNHDQSLLDDVQRGCFNYLWNEVGDPSGLVKDRRNAEVSNLAGVGFQLSALPIGVERGWITREQGVQRALQILRFLRSRADNRRDGIFLHYVALDTGDVYPAFRNEASAVDHALFVAGAIPAAVYFGGEVKQLVDEIAAESNWRAFLNPSDGFLHRGWRPSDNVSMKGPGTFIEHTWFVASDEERLIYLLATACPTPQFAIEPSAYYRLERTVRQHRDLPPFVVSWRGVPFNYFFSHCWIDYRAMAADEPGKFGVNAPRVDWFENSRRAILTHRQRCLEAAREFASFAPDRWGVSPCMGYDAIGRSIYVLQSVRPNLSNTDNWLLGTIAPYAAASAIMFTPAESMAAIRAYRNFKDADGTPYLWSDPAAGGFGFVDSFNLDQGRTSDDNVSIDIGPMILAIENARTGLIWRLFQQYPVVQQGMRRLNWPSRSNLP